MGHLLAAPSTASDRTSILLPRLLYALAACMALVSAGLAWWSWQSGRRFRDQLQRAAHVQAEVLARDFSENFRLSSDLRLRSALRAVLYSEEDWSPTAADSLLAIAARTPELRDVVGATFFWTARDSARITWRRDPPAHAEAIARRIAAVEEVSGPLAPGYFVLKTDADGREAFVYVTFRESRDGTMTKIGFSGNHRAFATAFMEPVLHQVAELRLGSAASRIVTWRIYSPSGDLILNVGSASADAERHSTPFWRARQSPDSSSAQINFLADAAQAEGGDVVVGRRTDPSRSPWMMTVLVEPAGMAQALYGAGMLPQQFVGALLLLSLILTGSTVVLASRLARHAREREAFATIVAHELRTPLTQILLHAETLQLDRAAERTRQDAARVVVRETRRLIHLVENALQFVRGRRSAMQLDIAPTALSPAVAQALDGLAPLWTDAVMHVERHLDPDAMAAVDARAVHQIVVNLVDNAVRYGSVGQTITVRVRVVQNRVRLSVEDEGPGIPADARARVFEPYVRDDRKSGNGLGLAIVRQLVELHDGRVWIEDGAIGARVSIEFPPVRSLASTGITPPFERINP